MVDEYARHSPDGWRSLCDDIGDEDEAICALLVGAVSASVAERRWLSTEMLLLLEENPPVDPAETLAVVLDPCDLWSLFESYGTYEALADLDVSLDEDDYASLGTATLAAEVERLTTDWHRERLAELVRRVRDQLPLETHAAASAMLAGACEAFEADERLRMRLASMLLDDSIDRIAFADQASPFAAAA
jgi:hypothetical protein